MTIELDQSEVEMLKEALDTWERAASQEGLVGSLLTVMLTPKELRGEMMAKDEVEMEKALQKGLVRKDRATLLRAKFIQASAKASEHEEVKYANTD